MQVGALALPAEGMADVERCRIERSSFGESCLSLGNGLVWTFLEWVHAWGGQPQRERLVHLALRTAVEEAVCMAWMKHGCGVVAVVAVVGEEIDEERYGVVLKGREDQECVWGVRGRQEEQKGDVYELRRALLDGGDVVRVSWQCGG
jgi:hypothetical protein